MFEFTNWSEEVKKRDNEIARLNNGINEVVNRLDELSKVHFEYWKEFHDSESYGCMNAYMNAISFIKEEIGDVNTRSN